MADVSVVMPAYNEAERIRQAMDRVLALDFIAELIVIDDGSLDGTAEIAEDFEDSRVTVIRQSMNQGKGAALRTGFAAAQAPYVAVHDADLEYDPADIERLLGPLRDGRADAVFGSRFIGSDEHRVLYYWHSVGNKILTTLSNMATNVNLTDMETAW